MNILVVDDNRTIRNLHVARIQHLDPTGDVSSAEDGSDALGVLGVKSIDLIVTDVRMEPLDGLELIREVRRSNLDLPIFVLASHPKDLEVARQLGATRTFEKGTGDTYVMFDEIEAMVKSRSPAE